MTCYHTCNVNNDSRSGAWTVLCVTSQQDYWATFPHLDEYGLTCSYLPSLAVCIDTISCDWSSSVATHIKIGAHITIYFVNALKPVHFTLTTTTFEDQASVSRIYDSHPRPILNFRNGTWYYTITGYVITNQNARKNSL